MRKTKCDCSARSFKKTARILKEIAEENRLKIICLLTVKELCACEIIGRLKLPHNLLSHHLKVLARSGIITQRKQGRFRLYKIDQKAFKSFKREFNSLTGG